MKVVSKKDYTEPNGDEVTELQVVFSSGSESALAEHGLDEGEITDFAEVGSDGLTHFLNVYTYRGYSDTDDGPVLTYTRDDQSLLSATYDFSGSIDEGGSPVKVLLGLTGDPAGEGQNEIDYKSTSHSVIDNLPHLPGFRIEDTYTVTIDATVTVTVDGSGTSGTVSGTKTSEGVTVVEGIFDSGMSMDVDGNITNQWDDRPAGTTEYGEGTVSLDDSFGITVPSKEELLARLREAVATKVRIEAIMAHDPDVGANLASQLTDIETSIADLEAAAAEAGATAEEIATAKSSGVADAASFDPANYVRNVHLIRGNADEVDWDWDGFKQGFWAGSGEVNYWLATPVRWLIDDVDSFYSRARERNWGATDLEGSWTQSITQATAAGGAGALYAAIGAAGWGALEMPTMGGTFVTGHALFSVTVGNSTAWYHLPALTWIGRQVTTRGTSRYIGNGTN